MAVPDLVLMGKVAGTHGIRGQLRIASYSGSGETFRRVKSIYLRTRDGVTTEYVLARAAGHDRKLLVALRDYNDINQVLPFVGAEVLLRRDQLPATEEGEFYWHDLIGMTAELADGSSLGTLSSIIETGSNDVFVIKSGRREYLVPALEDVVAVDLPNRRITVTPFPGLFDL